MWELIFSLALIAVAIAGPFLLYSYKHKVGLFGIPLGIVSVGFVFFAIDLLVSARLTCCTSQASTTFFNWFMATYVLMGLLSGLFLGTPLPFSLWWLSWLWAAGSSVVTGTLLSLTTPDASLTIVAYLFSFLTGLLMVFGGSFLWSISSGKNKVTVRRFTQ